MGCRMRAQRSLLLLWQREMGWRGLGPGSFPAPSRWGWMAVGDAVGSVLGDPTDGAVSHCSHSEGMRCVAVWAPPHHTARETEARIRPPASPLHSSAVTALPLGGWDAAGGASGEPRGHCIPPRGARTLCGIPPSSGRGCWCSLRAGAARTAHSAQLLPHSCCGGGLSSEPNAAALAELQICSQWGGAARGTCSCEAAEYGGEGAGLQCGAWRRSSAPVPPSWPPDSHVPLDPMLHCGPSVTRRLHALGLRSQQGTPG